MAFGTDVKETPRPALTGNAADLFVGPFHFIISSVQGLRPLKDVVGPRRLLVVPIRFLVSTTPKHGHPASNLEIPGQLDPR